MNILGIDTSSIVASMAVLSEEKLVAEYTVNNKKTHSEKMMGVLDKVLEDSGFGLGDIDAIAVTKGPGSFTGIRIGMASAQGMAHALGIPIIGVNTLDGLAYNLLESESLLCPVVDAQRGDVYTSLYRFEGDELVRLWRYEIIDAEALREKLTSLGKKVKILGDGVPVLNKVLGDPGKISPAHPVTMMPRASSVAALGLKQYIQGKVDDCFSVEPFYIRKSNAEEKWEERHGGKSLE
jgi:tRNA threonylcarbamoyladenosine biosynthesis protein TsaB